ncbi:MAG: undecaprenyl-diphosphatase UppP [Desulfovibrionales bacterium]|nr:undecaprenyl-diphosphatase UppP [Desulfovibrionales bacterium]
MNEFYAIFLGVIQGLTEFLPISSSGHLALLEHFFGLKEAGLGFDIMLHMGTLLAILVYFREDWWAMATSIWPGQKDDFAKNNHRLLIYLAIATIPGGVFGYLLEKKAETVFREPSLIAATLAAAGILLILAELFSGRHREFDDISLKDAVLIGLAQALAVVPGTSRSGITIAMGLFLGMKRQAAARFSFLLSAPIIFGAGLNHILDLYKYGPDGNNGAYYYIIGLASAGISGYLVIKYLLAYLRRHSLYVFAYYRLLIAGGVYLAVQFPWFNLAT